MELARSDARSMASNSPAGVGGIQGAHDFQLNNSSVSVVGGDSHTHVHYHGTAKDMKAILDAVHNLRKIQQDTLAKATPGTVEWLFETEYFTLWWDKNGKLKILWGSGIPGAGKTILASLVIDEVEQRAADPTNKICVAYFYMRYSEHGEVTVRSVLEVLVKQSVERHEYLFQMAEQVYERHIREGTQPTEAQLLKLLKQFTADMAITFYILDALDEAPIDIQHDLIKKLASLKARIFITSRPMQDVQTYFPEAHCFEIAAQDRDLDLHIAEKLQGSPRLQALLDRGQPSVKEKVISTVKLKCGGMFLHATLQLDTLQRCLNIHSVMKTLERFPTKIEDVYIQTWERILNQDPEHATLAKLALVWVLYAKRSLTISQLCQALATCPETHSFEEERLVPESTITDSCYGLLTVDKESQLVRLVHYTAKQPMEDLLRIAFPDPHSLLAAVCIARLTDCGFQDATIDSEEALDSALDADPLLEYAYNSWVHHIQESLDLDRSNRRVSAYVAGCQAFPVILDGHYIHPSFDRLRPLHIVAFYNLPIALAGPDIAHDPNTKTKETEATALLLACLARHHAAAQNLVCLPDIFMNARDQYGAAALTLACRNNDEDTVKLLLARPEVEVNLADNSGDTPLIIASHEGHLGIVKLLLSHRNINVNLANQGGDTALIKASHRGCTNVVALLLTDSGIKVNLANNDGDTALTLAASIGFCDANSDTIKLLLAHPDIEANHANNDGVTALMAASRTFGCDTIVAHLLAYPGINANLICKTGDTALLLAYIFSHRSTAKLLHDHPHVEIHHVNNAGYTVLMYASGDGLESMVKNLLGQSGVEVNVAGKDGLTALALASRRGYKEIVKLLLAHPGIEVNPMDESGDTPLIIASRKGYEGIVDLLLAHPSININLADRNGDTALMSASRKGHSSVTMLLLADPNCKVNLMNKDGTTALLFAASRESNAYTVRLHLHPDDTADQEYEEDALMNASGCGDELTVKLLLAHPDIEVNIADNNGDTPLIVASRKGYPGIVKPLLSHPSIEVNVINHSGDTCPKV